MRTYVFAFALVACIALAAAAISEEELPYLLKANGGKFTDAETKQLFAAHLAKYDIQLSEDEVLTRFAHYRDNLVQAANMMRRETNTATYGVSPFMHLSHEEWSDRYLIKDMRFGEEIDYDAAPLMKGTPRVDALPSSYDWRSVTPKVVSPIKNQEQCGSCWAFSATENIESQWAIAGNPLKILAPQQIVDCDTKMQGCNGGFPSQAMNYVKGAGGLELEKDYPYTGQNGQCAFNSADVAVTVDGWEFATKTQNETEVAINLVNWGPLSVCVDAGTWQTYTGGVVSAQGCGQQLDHGVGIVGYGNNAKGDFWIVRNSWGVQWGLKGYIKVEKGSNACGIAKDVSSATVTGQPAGGSTYSGYGLNSSGGSSGSGGQSSGGSTGGFVSGGSSFTNSGFGGNSF